MSVMREVIWITGGSGFSGAALVETVRAQSPESFVISLSNVAHSQPLADLSLAVDISDLPGLTALAKAHPPTRVFHLAGVLGFADWPLQYKVNVEGTQILLTALWEAGVRDCKLLSVGSAGEYLPKPSGIYTESDPVGGVTPYGRSKSAQSWIFLNAAKSFGYEAVVARVFNLVGPGLSRRMVLGEICHQIKSGVTELNLGNLDSERDFVDVRDVVHAYWLLSEAGEAGEVYNVSSGEAHAIRALVDMAVDLAGRPLSVKRDPGRVKSVDVNKSLGVCDKLKQATGWCPKISLAQSLRDMLESAS